MRARRKHGYVVNPLESLEHWVQSGSNIGKHGAALEATIGDKLEFFNKVTVVKNAAKAAPAAVNKGSHQAGMHVMRHCSQDMPRQPQTAVDRGKATGSPGWVAAAVGIAASILTDLMLGLGADDLLVQAVIEGALHAAHGHPLVYVLTWQQGQLVTCGQ